MRHGPRPAWSPLGLLLLLLLATSCATPGGGAKAVLAAPGLKKLINGCPADRLELPAPPGFTPEFTVIQLNDIYRIGPVRGGRAGGLSRVAALVEKTRAEGKPVFIMHAGDFLFPSLEGELFGGRMMVDALNYLDRELKGGEESTRGELLAVPGNHEFDEGAGPLVEALERSEFRWIASNLELTGEASGVADKLEKDALVQMGGMKVGIFALTIEDGPKGKDFARVPEGYSEAASKRLEELERRGAEVLIGLTHLRMTDDVPLLRELQRRHPKLLWIAGGHEHTCMYSQELGLVTKGDANAVRVWRLVFGRDGEGAPALRAEMIPLTEAFETSGDYNASVWTPSLKELEAKLPGYSEAIGRAQVPLEAREQCIRNVETNFGNYLTDLMRAEAGPTGPGESTLGAVNGGLIRLDDSVDGELSGEFLERTLGFAAPVCRAEVKGSDVKKLLEYSVSGNPGEGRFMQVSGLRFTFTRERLPNRRVTSVEVGDVRSGFSPLDEDKTYVLMTLERIMKKLEEPGGRKGYPLTCGRDLKELLREGLRKESNGIAPRKEGRITELNGADHCPEPMADSTPSNSR
ncbi:bifunctional metallophosphatase/5'-nucleotidase [Archangium lansingense]|uniref:Bifunctional metallophosphatase/5'-nucleotidase n=1 Tax=Archangium lansingense TaxID=2995310 RepID=A0ABT4AEN6_9BACT|nr:bifunctional metallophosphatase/5'-nucleotidase [Archangium lansinium]MCY1079374.1 bifunctional metallophosphatase/5'-nucleotidase [Archangium lansinium]